MRREIAEGIAVVARDPVLRTLAMALALRSFFGNFYGTLYDLYAVRDLGMSAGLLGVSIAGGGVGALIGALLASRVQRRFGLGTTLIGALLISASVGFLTPLAGGSPELATLMLFTAQVVGDGAMMIYMINALSLQQIVVPDHLLGRTNASMSFLAQGIAPVGALIAGGLGDGARRARHAADRGDRHFGDGDLGQPLARAPPHGLLPSPQPNPLDLKHLSPLSPLRLASGRGVGGEGLVQICANRNDQRAMGLLRVDLLLQNGDFAVIFIDRVLFFPGE